MKRILAIVCAVVLAASALGGCNQIAKSVPIAMPTTADSGTVSMPEPATMAPDQTATVAGNDASGSAASAADKTAPVNTGNNKVADGLEITAIPYSDDYSNSVYLLVTNKTGKDVDLKASVDFYGKDGNLVGFEDGSMDCVANGTTVCMDEFDCGSEPFATFEYKVTCSDMDSEYYAAVDQDLKMEVSPLADKVIVSLTNNGKIAAKYVWFHAFFFNNGRLVDVENSYCEDDDSEIKPGDTVRGYDYFYSAVEGIDSYDDVKVYFHGEGYKN